MKLEILLTYLTSIAPYLEATLNNTFEVVEEQEAIALYSDKFIMYFFEDKFQVLQGDDDLLDDLGEYVFVNDFDFLYQFAKALNTFTGKSTLEVYQVLFLHKFATWRDMVSYIAEVLNLEVSLQENGIQIQNIGIFTENGNKLLLATNDLFELTYNWEPGESLQDGVLSLFSTTYGTEDFLKVFVGDIENILSAPEMSEAKDAGGPEGAGGDIGGGDMGPDAGGSSPEGGGPEAGAEAGPEEEGEEEEPTEDLIATSVKPRKTRGIIKSGIDKTRIQSIRKQLKDLENICSCEELDTSLQYSIDDGWDEFPYILSVVDGGNSIIMEWDGHIYEFGIQEFLSNLDVVSAWAMQNFDGVDRGVDINSLDTGTLR